MYKIKARSNSVLKVASVDSDHLLCTCAHDMIPYNRKETQEDYKNYDTKNDALWGPHRQCPAHENFEIQPGGQILPSFYSPVGVVFFIGPYFCSLRLGILSLPVFHVLFWPFEIGVWEYSFLSCCDVTSSCLLPKIFEVSRVISHHTESRSLLTQSKGTFNKKTF